MKNWPFGEENKNILPLYDLLDNAQYKKFLKTSKYKKVPSLHMAYHFQNNPKKLADPFVDGNILIKERLENCDADYAISYAE